MTNKDIFTELEKLGIQQRPLDPSEEGEKIYEIKIPWSPEVFLDVCSIEGKYLPICCANISAARDIFLEAIRNGGWVDTKSLQEAYEYVLNCGNLEDGPVKDLFTICDLIKPVARDKEDKSLWKLDPNDYKESLRIVAKMATFIDYHGFFKNTEKNLLHIEQGKVKLYPALRTLLRELEKDHKTYEAFAIVDENGDFLQTVIGPAIYSDLKTVNECFKHIWEENREKYSVKEITFSIIEGIKFKE